MQKRSIDLFFVTPIYLNPYFEVIRQENVLSVNLQQFY